MPDMPVRGFAHVRRMAENWGGIEVQEMILDLPFRVPPGAAQIALEGAGWEVVEMTDISALMGKLKEIKKEALAGSNYIKLEEGVSTLGFVPELPQEEEREWQGQKRKTYLFKVRWIITPSGERIEFEEPKLFRASVRLAGEISDAFEKKLFELTGGNPDPSQIPAAIPIKIRREGTGSTTRYKVVG